VLFRGRAPHRDPRKSLWLKRPVHTAKKKRATAQPSNQLSLPFEVGSEF